MFNDNIKDYILDNITKKDFFDTSFLIEFRNQLIKEESDLKYSLLSIRSGNVYDYSWYDNKNVYLSYDMIYSYIKDYKRRYKCITPTLYFRNMCILESLLHEIVHAYQFMWKYTSSGLVEDILSEGDNIFNSIVSFKPLDFILTTFMYELHHDIYPFEIHADNSASMFLFDIYDESNNKSDFPLYKLSQVKNMLSKYKRKNNEIISPLRMFYKKMHLLDKYNNYDFDSLLLKERLTIGELSDISKINEVINEIMNTKNHDYSRLIKKH